MKGEAILGMAMVLVVIVLLIPSVYDSLDSVFVNTTITSAQLTNFLTTTFPLIIPLVVVSLVVSLIRRTLGSGSDRGLPNYGVDPEEEDPEPFSPRPSARCGYCGGEWKEDSQGRCSYCGGSKKLLQT